MNLVRVSPKLDFTLAKGGKIEMKGRWDIVQYEGIHIICTCYEGEENTRNGKWVELYSKLFIKYPYFFEIVSLFVGIFSILVFESLTISNVSYFFKK